MSKKSKVNAIKLEGVSLNADRVAVMSASEWAKFGKEAGYFTTIQNKTATPEQQTAMLSKAHELAVAAAPKPTPAKSEDPKK